MSDRSTSTRIESDSMGNVELPTDAYWGAQTQRAVDNFGVSPLRIARPMVQALGRIKQHAARANASIGTVSQELAEAIVAAAGEVAEGRWDAHFPIDVFQTGSGTSWNMNTNEVVSNRANEILGSPLGTRSPVHPNDHVNRGQSSNDVIPTAIRVSVRAEAGRAARSLRALADGLSRKAKDFADVVKLGRTHLQDAVPITLGNELGAWSTQMRKGAERIESCFPRLEELPLGGTAVGTGLNCSPGFADKAIAGLAGAYGIPFRPADDRFEAISARDAEVELMGAVNTVAVSLMKIANDIRLLVSGPRAGYAEIRLPSLQPGSSIMPGKINPVIPEMVIQVSAHLMGKHLAVSIGGQNAPLELNIMMPLIAHECLSALGLLANTCKVFWERCLAGLEADEQRCADWVEESLALVTPLALTIGYDKAAHLAHVAYEQKKKIRQVVIDEGILDAGQAAEVLDPRKMLG